GRFSAQPAAARVPRVGQPRRLPAGSRDRPPGCTGQGAAVAGGGDAPGEIGVASAAVIGRLRSQMPRVLHYRLHGLPEHRLERVHEQFEALAAARAWRCGEPWIASSQSRGLFEMEYFRHLKQEENKDLSASAFV